MGLLPVGTRIGPVLSGRAMSSCLLTSCTRTCLCADSAAAVFKSSLMVILNLNCCQCSRCNLLWWLSRGEEKNTVTRAAHLRRARSLRQLYTLLLSEHIYACVQLLVDEVNGQFFSRGVFLHAMPSQHLRLDIDAAEIRYRY